ncbi:efflux RND transporter periplasmic adaptor subunit [Thiomicrorhabdus sediminis]|nr:efflux RND transporter periplasmic adaptor subunit [Thiomicrorhabdus sediminis]
MQNSSQQNTLNYRLSFLALSALLLSSVWQTASANNTVRIGALVSGQVSKLYVDNGQQVKKGDKLVDIDAQRYQAKKALLQSQLKVAQLQFDDAQIEYDQALDLYDRTVTSKRSFDAAKLQYELAKAGLEKAKAELQHHLAWQKYVYIKAPIDGTVTKVFIAPGTTVFKENEPLIELKP